jgi:dihydropteroate synthase
LELSLVRIATVEQAQALFDRLGCTPAGAGIMAPKALLIGIRIDGLLPQAANILKQEMLAKGGEVAVPAGALCLNAEPVSCIVFGTVSQYTQLNQTLQGQPFGLPGVAARLRLLCALAATKPSAFHINSPDAYSIGGLVDCDRTAPGVRDPIANAVASAWNLLEQRCAFLMVEGSDASVVQEVAGRLVGRAACPVALWVHGAQPEDVGSLPQMVAEEHGAILGKLPTGAPVFALCAGPDPISFLQSVVSAGVNPEQLFITVAPTHDSRAGAEYLRLLPRIDAIVLRQRDMAALSSATIASAVTSLTHLGTSVFLTDAPSLVGEALAAIHDSPWS